VHSDTPARRPLRPPNELIALCLDRAGGRRGIRLASFVNDWAIEEMHAGHEIGIEQFSRSWSEGKRITAYTRLREFRAAFPEVGPKGTPHHIIVWQGGPP
jgi:hypothetical protein